MSLGRPKPDSFALIGHVLAARRAVYSALVECAAICDAVPHESDLVYRAVRGRLARVDRRLEEAEKMLREG